MPGKTSGTWKKGQKPPVQKPKGMRHKKTLLKESLGLSNWAKLQSYIEKEGAEKMVDELVRLKGKSFSIAYNSMIEYVKPKLARAEHTGEGGAPLFPKPDLSKLSREELVQFVELSKKIQPAP